MTQIKQGNNNDQGVITISDVFFLFSMSYLFFYRIYIDQKMFFCAYIFFEYVLNSSGQSN